MIADFYNIECTPGAKELDAQSAHPIFGLLVNKMWIFKHPILGPYFTNCAPNIGVLLPPLYSYNHYYTTKVFIKKDNFQ